MIGRHKQPVSPSQITWGIFTMPSSAEHPPGASLNMPAGIAAPLSSSSTTASSA
jgi:hypothetical protein